MTRQSSHAAVAAAVAATLLLSGCAGPSADATSSASPVAESTESPSPEPTAEATTEPTDAAVAPESQLPVDCTVVGDALAERLAGTTLDADPQTTTGFLPALDAQRGSLACRWRSDAPYALVMLDLARDGDARASAAGLTWNAGLGTPTSTLECGGAGACTGAALVGDVLAEFHLDSEARDATAGRLRQLAEPVLAALADWDETPNWEAPVGSWTQPLDCDTLTGASGLRALLGYRPGVVADITVADSGLSRALAGAGGLTACRWKDPGASGEIAILDVRMVAGAAWALDDAAITAGGDDVAVDGVDGAVMLCDAEDDCRLLAAAGANLVEFWGLPDPSYAGVPTLTAEELVEVAEVLAPALAELPTS